MEMILKSTKHLRVALHSRTLSISLSIESELQCIIKIQSRASKKICCRWYRARKRSQIENNSTVRQEDVGKSSLQPTITHVSNKNVKTYSSSAAFKFFRMTRT